MDTGMCQGDKIATKEQQQSMATSGYPTKRENHETGSGMQLAP